MKEKDYHNLCKICDELLMSAEQKLSIIAIPWLHVLRFHPVINKKYEILFLNKQTFYLIIRNALIVFKGLIHISISLLIRGYKKKHLYERYKKIDYLFVSHILNENQAGCLDDFYFGSVPTMLSAQNKSVVIVLLNHTGKSAHNLLNKWDKKSVHRVILTNNISIWKSILIYRQMLAAFFEIRSFKQNLLSSFSRKVANIASVQALSSGAFANIRLELQIAEIVKNCAPSNLITTYEGHAYERMIFHAAKRMNENICCFGYQHSALFELQHSFWRALNKKFSCDVLLTPSVFFKDRLLRENKMKGITIEVLGSNRGVDLFEKKTDISSKHCLVLPEGFIEECDILFSFSLEVARENPNLFFIWRLHPAINFEQLKKRNSIYDKIPSNIILSNQSLEYDINRSSKALYRGSTAIVKAVSSGLVPVYLNSANEEVTIDPLFFLKEGKVIVTTPKNYKEKFSCPDLINLNDVQFKTSMNLCKNLFDPFDVNVFSKL